MLLLETIFLSKLRHRHVLNLKIQKLAIKLSSPSIYFFNVPHFFFFVKETGNIVRLFIDVTSHNAKILLQLHVLLINLIAFKLSLSQHMFLTRD